MTERREPSPGERAIANELRRMKIKYVREKWIEGLKGDSENRRRADFYLPEYDVYIEFLGNWDTSIQDKQRYREKRDVYEQNGIKCIYIFPNQLHYSPKVIRDGLKKYGVKFERTQSTPDLGSTSGMSEQSVPIWTSSPPTYEKIPRHWRRRIMVVGIVFLILILLFVFLFIPKLKEYQFASAAKELGFPKKGTLYESEMKSLCSLKCEYKSLNLSGYLMVAENILDCVCIKSGTSDYKLFYINIQTLKVVKQEEYHNIGDPWAK